jgi:hypothetical protein
VAGTSDTGILNGCPCRAAHRGGEKPCEYAPLHKPQAKPPLPCRNQTLSSQTYDSAALPHFGKPGAKCELLEYFDYTCGEFRQMHGHL